MRNQVWRLVIVVSLLPFAYGVEDSFDVRFAAVRDYWEWSKYFSPYGLDFPGAVYRPGKSFKGLVYYCVPMVPGQVLFGFCSKELGICQAYRGYPDGSIQLRPEWTPIRPQESSMDAYRRSVGSEIRYFQTEERQVTLPTIDKPRAVRENTRNLPLENYIRERPFGRRTKGCRSYVPYSDASYVLVPILTICQGKPDNLYFLTKDDPLPNSGGAVGYHETVGGTFPDGDPLFALLKSRILQNIGFEW